MNRFNKFFYYEVKNNKDINLYLRKNKDNCEVIRLERFKGTNNMPPIFDSSASSLYEELTSNFSICQVNGSTNIGRKVNKIITSNLLTLYPEIVKHLTCQIDIEIESLKSLSNDPKTPCMKFIDLNVSNTSELKTPWLDFFMSSFSEPDAKRFMLYIASLVDINNTHKQSMLILDKVGNSGKSAFMNSLIKYLGDDTTFIALGNCFESRFSMANLKNKKLLYVPENKNPNLMFTQTMMAITGGDRLDGEVKGVQETYRFIPDCKVIIVSNTPLSSTGKEHHNTRQMVVEVQKVKRLNPPIEFLNEDGSFKFGNAEMSRFYDTEMPYFVSKCIDYYNSLGKPAQIPLIEGSTVLEQFLTDQNRIYTECFLKYFEYSIDVLYENRLPINVVTFFKKEIHQKLKEESINFRPSNTDLKSELGINSKFLHGKEFITNIKLKDNFIFENGEIVLKKFKKINNDEI